MNIKERDGEKMNGRERDGGETDGHLVGEEEEGVVGGLGESNASLVEATEG